MTVDLYENSVAKNKKLVLFEKGDHAGAFCTNREEYIKNVKEFLKEIEF